MVNNIPTKITKMSLNPIMIRLDFNWILVCIQYMGIYITLYTTIEKWMVSADY
jgi:hypothetical protein